MSKRSCLRLGALLALGACAAESNSSEPVELVLGTGEQRFEPLERGQRARLYAGTQGGYHVWLSFRVRGLSPDDVRMMLDLTPAAEGSMPSHWNLPISLAHGDAADSMLELIGWRAQILQPECAVGSPVTIALTLQDTRGVRANAESMLVPEPPEEGFRRTCRR